MNEYDRCGMVKKNMHSKSPIRFHCLLSDKNMYNAFKMKWEKWENWRRKYCERVKLNTHTLTCTYIRARFNLLGKKAGRLLAVKKAKLNILMCSILFVRFLKLFIITLFRLVHILHWTIKTIHGPKRK